MLAHKQWQLQEAKAKFSQLVEQTLRDGPQIITRHGKETVAMVPISHLRKHDMQNKQTKAKTLLDVLMSAPRVPGFKTPSRSHQTKRKPPSPSLDISEP